MSAVPKPQIFLANNPTVTRLVPELAEEIGLNESIMLLQIDFWISTVNHCIEDRYWTYQSVRKIQETFKFWSTATINRIITSLENSGYIFTGNHNTRKGDTTRWFALNPEKLGELKSLEVVFQSDKTVSQNETPLLQNETPITQNETTLPENTTENTPEINTEKKRTPKRVAQPKTPRTSPYEGIFNALLKSFGLDKAHMTDSADSEYWAAATKIGKAGATCEDVPELHQFVKNLSISQGWSGFTVNALVKRTPDYFARKAAIARRQAAEDQDKWTPPADDELLSPDEQAQLDSTFALLNERWGVQL